MNQMLFDFVAQIDRDKEFEDLINRRNDQRKYWKICWDWDGPKVGEPLEVGSLTAKEFDSGNTVYHYCAPCIAEKEIEPDVWIVSINYSDSAPAHCKMMNGTKLILGVEDIWAPTHYLRNLRDEQ